MQYEQLNNEHCKNLSKYFHRKALFYSKTLVKPKQYLKCTYIIIIWVIPILRLLVIFFYLLSFILWNWNSESCYAFIHLFLSIPECICTWPDLYFLLLMWRHFIYTHTLYFFLVIGESPRIVCLCWYMCTSVLRYDIRTKFFVTHYYYKTDPGHFSMEQILMERSRTL